MAAPSRLDDFKWYLFAGIAALFAMGAILLTRKQVFIAAGDVDEDAAPPSTKSAKPAPPAKPKKAPPAPAPAPPPVPPANVAAEVNQQVGLSMDSLKDQIFRLELRRQAGTISEEDYAREKARFDKLLRDLVKG
jgi:type IV secretory pathway VirB10-like protein